ncbi:MAG TPA: hypothetical protein DCZ95_07585 [Verrucomicrobia bacterium]|nr:MAG: hypothetical protein A2X46_01225 [Lentisphaerae bacterium GWF2_57_35]HBA83936.1 hypothetical protein [Verrucomicrobiota bacterium]
MPIIDAEHYARLAAKMDAIGRFSGCLAHDFNNILSGVLGYASYIKMKLDPSDRMYGDLGMIEQSGARAVELTGKLMSFAPGRCSAKDRVAISQAIRTVVEKVKPALPAGIEFKVEAPQDLPLFAGDMVQVIQMIHNIVLNALEAMTGCTGVIRIQAECRALTDAENKLMIRVKQTPCLCLTITDQGKGMNLDTQLHLFEPFFTTKNPRKGAGLGLAVVYGIVAIHQGDITFESQEGKGSTFRIYLPPVKPT